MSEDTLVEAKIDSTLKSEVEQLFKELGLSTAEAITLFYEQVKLSKGLPFETDIPNRKTQQTFDDTDASKNIVRCETLSEMFENLGI